MSLKNSRTTVAPFDTSSRRASYRRGIAIRGGMWSLCAVTLFVIAQPWNRNQVVDPAATRLHGVGVLGTLNGKDVCVPLSKHYELEDVVQFYGNIEASVQFRVVWSFAHGKRKAPILAESTTSFVVRIVDPVARSVTRHGHPTDSQVEALVRMLKEDGVEWWRYVQMPASRLVVWRNVRHVVNNYLGIALGIVFVSGVGVESVWWWRRARRRAAGGCRECGYPVASSTAVCPECGTVYQEVLPR